MDLTFQAVNSLVLGGVLGVFGSALATFVELEKHEGVREKIRDELCREGLLHSLQEDLKESDLTELTYTKAAAKEVLRINPPIPAVLRTCQETFSLKGFKVPRGWKVGINILDVHESALPEENVGFKPERFIEGTAESKLNKSYLPFGHGSMMCPGNKLGAQVQLIFLIELMRRIDWSPTEGPAKLSYSFSQFEKDPISCIIKEYRKSES